ncbi:MAG: type IX secretion system membrane protein PorP/SprF [Sphingobacteriaceae bacterium]|nr:type IX secretion system membrane protein PorP/SprF [Sphingobacteriaceae bacterium]
MKRVFILILFALTVSGLPAAFAQQTAMFTQYMFNTLALNPGYAGSRNVISATALLRTQWVGVDGAPRTQTFTIDAPVNQKKIGLGLQLFSDKLGKTSNTGIVASYAYRIRMDKASLSFGLQANMSQFTTNFNSVDLDPSGLSVDPAFISNDKKTLYNFGTGIYYNSDRFYAGLSSPELMNTVLPGSQTKGNRQSLHVFLMSGYVLSLNNTFKLKPSFLLKGVQGAPLEADLNASVWIKDILCLGAQYRTNADLSGLIEIQASPQFRLGYSYDHSTTPLSKYNSGSHEIMLRYEFGFQRDKVLTPRYF